METIIRKNAPPFRAMQTASGSIATRPLLMLALIVGAASGWAQNYSLDWFTIDGGGGTSTGGVYAVSGTIGQPDAGVSSNGAYTVTGGFWGVVGALQTPGAPLLAVSRNPLNGVVTVSWPQPAPGWVLVETPRLVSLPQTNSWALVGPPYSSNATHFFIALPAPTGTKLYRLRRP